MVESLTPPSIHAPPPAVPTEHSAPACRHASTFFFTFFTFVIFLLVPTLATLVLLHARCHHHYHHHCCCRHSPSACIPLRPVPSQTSTHHPCAQTRRAQHIQHRHGQRKQGQFPAQDTKGHEGLYVVMCRRRCCLCCHACVHELTCTGSGTDVVLRENIFSAITSVFK